MRADLPQNGLPASTAADIVDIYASMNSDALAEDYEQQKPALSKVKLAGFARSSRLLLSGNWRESRCGADSLRRVG
jgi:hypothetical protein